MNHDQDVEGFSNNQSTFSDSLIKEILVYLKLPNTAYSRRLLGTLMCSDRALKMNEITEKTYVPRPKAHCLIQKFIQIGIVETIPIHVFPEDWETLNVTERREYKRKHSLPLKGRYPIRYRFNHENMIQKLTHSVNSRVFEIDRQAEIAKKRIAETYESVVYPLMNIVEVETYSLLCVSSLEDSKV